MRDRHLNHQEAIVALEIERDIQIANSINDIALGDIDGVGFRFGDEVTFQQHDQPELGGALRQVQADDVFRGRDADKCEILSTSIADQFAIQLSLMLQKLHGKSL